MQLIHSNRQTQKDNPSPGKPLLSDLNGTDALLEVVDGGDISAGAGGLLVQRDQAVAEGPDAVLKSAEAVRPLLQLHRCCLQLRPLLDHTWGGRRGLLFIVDHFRMGR